LVLIGKHCGDCNLLTVSFSLMNASGTLQLVVDWTDSALMIAPDWLSFLWRGAYGLVRRKGWAVN